MYILIAFERIVYFAAMNCSAASVDNRKCDLISPVSEKICVCIFPILKVP